MTDNAALSALDTAPPTRAGHLPLGALLALTLASFIATANESVPAGLLPQIAQAFQVSPAWAGQWVTFCALGSGAAAIPMTLLLQGQRRRKVLLAAVAVFFIGNAVTALSPWFGVTLAARLLVGVATGLAWSLLAGYARRLVPAPRQGSAMAIAMLGIPLALAVGVPLGAWLGKLAGWRCVFAALSALSLALLVWIRLKVPDHPGHSGRQRFRLRQVLRLPGVLPVLLLVMLWNMAHYILYTYITAYLASVGLGEHADVFLLVFGVSALLGVWMAGALISGHLKRLVLLNLGAFAGVALVLGLGHLPVALSVATMAVWGLSYGGSPTLLQTALADAAGEGADVAQSMLVTVFNLSFAASGVIGGVLLASRGASSFPWVLLALLLPALLIALRSFKARG